LTGSGKKGADFISTKQRPTPFGPTAEFGIKYQSASSTAAIAQLPLPQGRSSARRPKRRECQKSATFQVGPARGASSAAKSTPPSLLQIFGLEKAFCAAFFRSQTPLHCQTEYWHSRRKRNGRFEITSMRKLGFRFVWVLDPRRSDAVYCGEWGVPVTERTKCCCLLSVLSDAVAAIGSEGRTISSSNSPAAGGVGRSPPTIPPQSEPPLITITW
jgi:hypothetical protein